MKTFTILLLLFFIITRATQAQDCTYFPADCPQTGDIEAAQDSAACINNLVVAEEITMQNNLRKAFTSMMEEIARNKNWEVYEYTEGSGGGVGSDGKATPYPQRRPYEFMISFNFIVNKDSLEAWQTWYSNDLKNASEKVVDSYKQSANNLSDDKNAQEYLDSAMYYSNLKAKYMSDHAAEYQKAILGGDTKTQKKYEEELKRYDDKINAFINRKNDKTDATFSASKSQFGNLETYKHKNTIAFRNGSTIRVTFNVNDYITTANDGDKKIVKQLATPATLALLMHNDSPNEHEVFGQYLRSPDVALFLFGKWLSKPDGYHNYHAGYFADKKNMDAVTVKKIPCDKVQTIVLHIEGSQKYFSQFLQLVDMEKLNSLVVKE